MLRWCPSYPAVLKLDGSPGDCGGVYTGVVTGIYMQRMLIELDKIVWLLIDDQHLAPSHSLRVGAVVCIDLYFGSQIDLLFNVMSSS